MLLVTVIVHEAGHAIAMRRRGVEIEELGIGFSLSKKYRLSFRVPFVPFPVVLTPFLFGAYVRPTEAGAEKMYHMGYKDQAVCYSAGVIMNVIYAAAVVLIGGTIISITEHGRLPNPRLVLIIGGFTAAVVIFRRALSMITPVFGFIFLCIWATYILEPYVAESGLNDPFSFGELVVIGESLAETLAFSAVPSLLIAFFNMIPFIPLDGGHVLGAFFRTHGWVRRSAVYNMSTGIFLLGFLLGRNAWGWF